MTSAGTVEYRLRRSRARARALVVGHVFAAAGWLAAGFPAMLLLGGWSVLAMSLWRELRAAGPDAVRADACRHRLVGMTARRRPGRVRLLPGVISVTLGPPGGRALVLFDDQFRDPDHKALRRLLRHGPGPGAC